MQSAARPSATQPIDILSHYLTTVITAFGGSNIEASPDEKLTVKFTCKDPKNIAKIKAALDIENKVGKSPLNDSVTLQVDARELAQNIEHRLITFRFEAVAESKIDIFKPEGYAFDSANQLIITSTPFAKQHKEIGLELDDKETGYGIYALRITDMMLFVAAIHHLKFEDPKPQKKLASQARMLAKFKELSNKLAKEAENTCTPCEIKQKLVKKLYIDTILKNPAPTMRAKILNVNMTMTPENLQFVQQGKKSHRVKDLIDKVLQLRNKR